jgi:hypothetical protein
MQSSQVALRASQDQNISTSVVADSCARTPVAFALHEARLMKITSLLLGLGILGSSSVALAQSPYQPRGDYTDRFYDELDDPYFDDGRLDRRRYDDRRYDRDRFDQRRNTTWVALTHQMQQRSSREVIQVPTRMPFWQMRLQHQTGRSYIDAIVIEFSNGQRQVVRIGRVIQGRERVNIDLHGDLRRVDRVIIHGRPGPRGLYQLYAM